MKKQTHIPPVKFDKKKSEKFITESQEKEKKWKEDSKRLYKID
jgi:hypothetical protein